MGRLILAGTGTLLLLAKAHAVRLRAVSSDRLVAPAPRKQPGSAAEEPAGGWAARTRHESDREPRCRTWEAALLGRRRRRLGGEKSQARRALTMSVAATLRGGAGRGGGRGAGERGGRAGGARGATWEDGDDEEEEDYESYDDDESEGYDDNSDYDDEDDLSDQDFSYARRAGGGGGPARTSGGRGGGGGRGGMGGRKRPVVAPVRRGAAPAPAKSTRNAAADFYSDEDDDGGGSGYDDFSDHRGGRGGGGASFDTDDYDYDDEEQYDDEKDFSYGADSLDDLDNGGRYGSSSNSRRRPQPPSGRRGGNTGREWGRGSRGGRSGGGGRGRERRGPKPPARMERLKAKLADAQVELKTKMSGVTHKGAKVMRELKGSVSSDLEKTLIKATRPDNDPAKRKHVNLLLQAAEHSFPVYMDPKDDGQALWKEGPYWMTLHKLWRRMAEKDYRTATKAVYVLHRLARGTTAESWGYFRSTLQQMRREEDNGTKSRYFSRRVIRNVDEEGRRYSEWLDDYAEFALLRLQSFAPDLSELAAVHAETPHEDASRSLEKAAKLIEAALACELGPELDNDVTCDCLKLVVEDLCELWSLFQQKLEIRIQQRFTGDGFSSGELRRTLGFLEFYLEQLSTARDMVHESHRLLAQYSHAVPKGLGDEIATDMLQEQVAWIQEELAEKAKASVGKSVTGSDGDSPAPAPARTSPPPSAAKKRRTVGGGAATGRRPRAPAPTTEAAAAAAAPPASKKPTAMSGKKGGGGGSATEKPAVSTATKKRKGSGSGGGGGGGGTNTGDKVETASKTTTKKRKTTSSSPSSSRSRREL